LHKYTFLLPVFFVILFLLFVSLSGNSYAILGSELLTKPWILKANNLSQERYQLIDPNALIGKKILRLTYNLNGICLLSGDASALIFDQPFGRTWRYVSLSKYGKNCLSGEQTVDIPLSNFSGLDLEKQVGTFHIRIWHYKPYNVEIKSAILYNPETDIIRETSSFGQLMNNFLPPATPIPSAILILPTVTPTAIPTVPPSLTPAPIVISPSSTVIPSKTSIVKTPTPTPTQVVPTDIPPTAIPADTSKASWSIQSVSSMKETKDRICNIRDDGFITNWINTAAELGSNYVSIETPYENPGCGNSLAYTEKWVREIRGRQLKVWHRHMPLAFEGIYDTAKNSQKDYLNVIFNYIKNNPQFFAEGDIFSPIPEPQNGGIRGVTYCSQGICQFQSAAHFNHWLRDAMDIAESAFKIIGLGNKIKIGYFGFDGFVAWGDNNPDWNGILEDETVLKMGNITIDHYPEIVGDNMENDLNELEARYPNIPIIIGEWGTITGGDTETQVKSSMLAAKRLSVVGFNYWHMGAGGNEALITEKMVKNKQFDDVERFYKHSDRL